jgi:putative ABC transport system permease protein
MDVKLTGQKIPETLAALERLWKSTGASDPPVYFFLSDYVQALYVSVLRFAQAFGIFSAIAVMLACLGLIGLSASITDRRRKEIGVRKAMGAGTASILRLLLWQFTKPVLWAALVAWPLTAWLMSRWLDGFAYHVDLTPLPFFASAVLTLCVALLTVSAHSYSVARSQPVQALRHE